MARRPRGGGSHHDDDDRGDRERERHHEREREPYYDDPAEHLEIERRRFAGGMPPTPEIYALAREQWHRLPGALVRPSMDPPVGAPAPDKPQSSEQAHPSGKGSEQ